MVIDDEVAQNDIEKSGLKLATPPGVKAQYLASRKSCGKYLLENMIANDSLS